MKTTRTYQQGCKWCNGTGFVKQPNNAFLSLALTVICPVCYGNKTITVAELTETFEPQKQSIGIKTPEEILDKCTRESLSLKKSPEIVIGDIIKAMHEYHAQFPAIDRRGVTDEEIEKWAESGICSEIKDNLHKALFIDGAIFGAKALRDGKIK